MGYGTKKFTSHFNISSTNKRRDQINVWKGLPTSPSVAKPHFLAMLPDLSFLGAGSVDLIRIKLGLGYETYDHHAGTYHELEK